MLTELASMADLNISEFITYNCTRSREFQQRIRARVTETTVPEQHEGGSSSKGVVCGCMRRTCGRKMDVVQWFRAITPGDHVPDSKILHR
jgi:hypothetical protein